jgi:hypothetical protein
MQNGNQRLPFLVLFPLPVGEGQGEGIRLHRVKTKRQRQLPFLCVLPLPVGEGWGEGTRLQQSYPVTASSIGGFSISVIMVLAISRSPITT